MKTYWNEAYENLKKEFEAMGFKVTEQERFLYFNNGSLNFKIQCMDDDYDFLREVNFNDICYCLLVPYLSSWHLYPRKNLPSYVKQEFQYMEFKSHSDCAKYILSCLANMAS